VIVIDVNLLVFAYDETTVHHIAARLWLEDVFSNVPLVYLPWQCICGFFRTMTNPRLPGRRYSVEEAAAVIDLWLSLPNIRAVGPGADHWTHFRRMLVEGQAAGPLGRDAALAALTAELGSVFYTADRGFARYPGLRWKNPLV
jgi:toxin-antitoxin system PIN domain toxin